MNFIACADLHITDKVPANRKPDYYLECLDKFEQILQIASESDMKLLVVAGDMFDSTKVSYGVTRKIMEIMNQYIENKLEVFVVPGQHDCNYHFGSLLNTPLGILETAGLVKVLETGKHYFKKGVSFVGTGWNEEPESQGEVLVTHQMVTYKGELWPGQTNYSTSHAILRKYPWAKLIISGDNHLPHLVESEGRLQINCGSMLRKSKDQIEFLPRVWSVDTEYWTTSPIFLKIKPAEDVFDLDKIELEEITDIAKKEADEKIKAFIQTLPETEKERPNFKLILQSVVKQTNPSEEVVKIINSIMEKVS